MMTVADRITIRKTAAELRKWLAERGIQVRDSRVLGRSAVLTVTGPVPAEIADQVMVITENIGGLVRRTWAARLGGCCLHWREDNAA